MQNLEESVEPPDTQRVTSLSAAPIEERDTSPPSAEEESQFLRLSRANDPERNARTRLPPGETIRLNSICITEIFLPSHVQHLVDGLRAVDWLDTNRYGEHESLTEWISYVRSPLGGRAWARIGSIYPIGAAPPDWLVAGRVAERVLREGIDSVDFELVQITASVTAMVAQFAMNTAAAESLNTPLSTDYVTELEANQLGQTIWSPEFLRKRETTRRRGELRDRCAATLRDLFPGFFAEEGEFAAYPSVDFLSVAKTAVVELAATQKTSFLSALAVDGYWDTFSNEPRSALLVWDRAMRPASRAVSIITTNPAGSSPKMPIEIHRSGVLFATLALRDALVDAIHEVGDLRDTLALGDGEDFLPSEEAIRRVETVLVSLGADVRPVFSELEETETLQWIEEDLPVFAGLDPKFNDTQLPDALTSEIRLGAQSLSRVLRDVSASVQTLSALASAGASRELTRSNRRLQFTALAIAVASLIVAVISLVTRK